MKKARKWVIIILVIVMVGSLIPTIAAIFINPNKANDNSDVLKPLKSYISTLYYGKGKYSDYKALLANPEKALTEVSFLDVRKGTTAKDYFKYDSDSPDSLMKHMVVVRQDEKVQIYYLKDINSKEEIKTAKVWTLVSKNGNWLIEN